MTSAGAGGRIGEYGWWQLRDYVFGPAIWSALVAFMLGLFPMLMATMNAPEEMAQQVVRQTYGVFVGLLALVTPMFAVARLVSADRQPGLARFLFSKPVAARRYYAQAWILRGIVVLLMALVAAVAVDRLMANFAIIGTVASVGLSFLLIGGVGYLLSVLIAQDALLLILFFLVPGMLNGLTGVLPRWKGLIEGLLFVLPPMHKLEPIRNALLSGGVVPRGDVFHVALYGVGCAVLATWLIRRLPLVR